MDVCSSCEVVNECRRALLSPYRLYGFAPILQCGREPRKLELVGKNSKEHAGDVRAST